MKRFLTRAVMIVTVALCLFILMGGFEALGKRNKRKQPTKHAYGDTCDELRHDQIVARTSRAFDLATSPETAAHYDKVLAITGCRE